MTGKAWPLGSIGASLPSLGSRCRYWRRHASRSARASRCAAASAAHATASVQPQASVSRRRSGRAAIASRSPDGTGVLRAAPARPGQAPRPGDRRAPRTPPAGRRRARPRSAPGQGAVRLAEAHRQRERLVGQRTRHERVRRLHGAQHPQPLGISAPASRGASLATTRASAGPTRKVARASPAGGRANRSTSTPKGARAAASSRASTRRRSVRPCARTAMTPKRRRDPPLACGHTRSRSRRADAPRAGGCLSGVSRGVSVAARRWTSVSLGRSR